MKERAELLIAYANLMKTLQGLEMGRLGRCEGRGCSRVATRSGFARKWTLRFCDTHSTREDALKSGLLLEDVEGLQFEPTADEHLVHEIEKHIEEIKIELGRKFVLR